MKTKNVFAFFLSSSIRMDEYVTLLWCEKSDKSIIRRIKESTNHPRAAQIEANKKKMILIFMICNTININVFTISSKGHLLSLLPCWLDENQKQLRRWHCLQVINVINIQLFSAQQRRSLAATSIKLADPKSYTVKPLCVYSRSRMRMKWVHARAMCAILYIHDIQIPDTLAKYTPKQ